MHFLQIVSVAFMISPLGKISAVEKEQTCQLEFPYEGGDHTTLKRKFIEEYLSSWNTWKNIFTFNWSNSLMWKSEKQLVKICVCFAQHVFTHLDTKKFTPIEGNSYTSSAFVTDHLNIGRALWGGGLQPFVKYKCAFDIGSFYIVMGYNNYGFSRKFDAYVTKEHKLGEMVLMGVGRKIPN